MSDDMEGTKYETASQIDLNQLNHREVIREKELEKVVQFLRPGSSVLEIGAGAGWQAKKLSELGYKVSAIDIPQTNYKDVQVWPVESYDGKKLPFEDESFDVVFSSNVLEHIVAIDEFQTEMQRVLKTGGRAVHVMPSSTWRFWTTCTFFLSRPLRLVRKIWRKKEKKFGSTNTPAATPTQNKKIRILPARHGERGNVLTEVWYFSPIFWKSLFKRAGWSIETATGTGIFYSGTHLLGFALPLSFRMLASRLLGSSCIVYVLRKESY